MSRPRSLRRRCAISVPAQCRDLIERGALVAVNSSGGKDSQCMTILLSRIVPLEQLLIVHAPLGEVEWPGTVNFIESTIPAGVPFILAPIASGKSLLETVEQRGRWPSPKARYCTAGHYGELTIGIARAPARFARRPHAALLDALEERFPGCDGRQDERNARRDRVLDVAKRSIPLHLAERGVDGDELVGGNDAGDKQAHGLAVLAPRDVEGNERAAADHVPALGRYREIGVGPPAAREGPAHGFRPSWSARTMV